jgi:23S rRNA (adenine2503-C2)-methyltransferase
MLPDELDELVSDLGQPAYRTRQILDWLYVKGVRDVGEMTNLSKSLRKELMARTALTSLRQVALRESATGEAVKFLFELPQGQRIESVLIFDGDRRTVCLSSQVGCPLDCKFCATGRMGLIANLGAGQIVDQLLQVSLFARERGERVTNVVMMGMGEPLLNYEQVVRALKLMRLEEGLGLGGRKITVSTAGYLPGIRKLAQEDLNVGLAISLNATTDEMRERLMPINRKYKIADLLQAAREYFDLRGRRVTFEYVLMAGLTDTQEDARRLAGLTRGIPCKINLIPYNEHQADGPFRRPARKHLEQFYRTLEECGAAFTVRESRGRDIDAACGQLYHQQEKVRAPT